MRAGARSSLRAVPAVDFCASNAATTSSHIRSEEPREAKASTRETDANLYARDAEAGDRCEEPARWTRLGSRVLGLDSGGGAEGEARRLEIEVRNSSRSSQRAMEEEELNHGGGMHHKDTETQRSEENECMNSSVSSCLCGSPSGSCTDPKMHAAQQQVQGLSDIRPIRVHRGIRCLGELCAASVTSVTRKGIA